MNILFQGCDASDYVERRLRRSFELKDHIRKIGPENAHLCLSIFVTHVPQDVATTSHLSGYAG